MEVVNDSGCHNNDQSLDLAMSYIDNSKCKCPCGYFTEVFTDMYS